MGKRELVTRKLTGLGAALLVGLLGTTTRVAADGGDPNFIHFCKAANGTVRVVGASQACAGG